jgi:hypothetical protein
MSLVGIDSLFLDVDAHSSNSSGILVGWVDPCFLGVGFMERLHLPIVLGHLMLVTMCWMPLPVQNSVNSEMPPRAR